MPKKPSSTKPSEHAPPKRPPGPAAVVGIGASAGGLSALKQLFETIPADSGVAFVVVVHLAAQYDSHLAELIQPHARLPVQQVTETTALEPNNVYVIPPNSNLSAVDTHLRLSDLEEKRERRAPIDHFFRTLASTYDGSSIGVILSGTGSDGTLGIKEIKACGGFTIVQSPAEAEFDGMPQSALSTGLVDRVLPLADIPDAILSYVRTRPRVQVPKDDEDIQARDARLLQKLFAHLRARTGRDFRHYKRSTVLRRIARRMQIHRLEPLEDYVELIHQNPKEVQALADDLLITVTNFFRDTEVFEVMAKDVIPGLFDRAGEEPDIRVWSVGCATGEEAYSIAMLLMEEAGVRNSGHRLQVFATDLHERSLAHAREGIYSGDIDIDVSPERIRRFFKKENGGYRIRKEVRELVVFAPHNVLSDPPFSRIDMIVCRNLLIYLNRDIQREVMEIFHYGLRKDGVLVLGTSETVDATELFRPEHKKQCVFRKRNVPPPEPRLPVFPVLRSNTRALSSSAEISQGSIEYRTLHSGLVEQWAPPNILLNPDDRVVHLSEDAGRFLINPAGEPTSSIHRLVPKELRIELRTALHSARSGKLPARSQPVDLQIRGVASRLALEVHPALDPQHDGFVLLVFSEVAPRMEPAAGSQSETRFQDMTTELDSTRVKLQSIIEQYEASQEEMKASNEELQSANEELRSTMEELETSKEELQSMNEELQTVNQENRHKVEELAQLTGDLQNLLAATDIATLFLDRELRIMRFTPKVGELFSVRVTDRARPISELTHRLGYDDLLADARSVLERLIPIEREVMDEAGRWYLTRVLPYRSTREHIDGVVLTFVDITARKAAEEEIRKFAETLEERVAERTLELQQQEERVRRLAATLATSERHERLKLSQLLHDDLQQLLYGIQMKLALERKQAVNGEYGELLEQTDRSMELLDQAITITRRLTVDLSPPVLEGEGLSDSMHWLRSHMRDLHGLEVDVVEEAGADVHERELRILLFHVVRELLFNVAKHSGVERATIRMEPAGDGVRITVSDDGKGFVPHAEEDPAEGNGSFGLFSIRERLRLQNGDLKIESSPGKGTHVSIYAPGGSSE